MQEGVYKTPVGDVSELRQRLIDCWSSLSQDIINDAINQWQVRLRACVKVKVCHFWASSALKPALFRATHDFQKKHALFSVCSLRDDNVITSKPTWKLKHTNSILEYSEYFCQIYSKSLLVILSYTVLKLRRFFETQCIANMAVASFPRYTNLLVKKSYNFLTPCIAYSVPPLWVKLSELSNDPRWRKTRMTGLSGDEMFCRFDTKHACDTQTDRRKCHSIYLR